MQNEKKMKNSIFADDRVLTNIFSQFLEFEQYVCLLGTFRKCYFKLQSFKNLLFKSFLAQLLKNAPFNYLEAPNHLLRTN